MDLPLPKEGQTVACPVQKQGGRIAEEHFREDGESGHDPESVKGADVVVEEKEQRIVGSGSRCQVRQSGPECHEKGEEGRCCERIENPFLSGLPGQEKDCDTRKNAGKRADGCGRETPLGMYVKANQCDETPKQEERPRTDPPKGRFKDGRVLVPTLRHLQPTLRKFPDSVRQISR